MATLFETDPAFPDGFSYHPDFLSGPEELQLMETVGTLQLRPLIFQGFEAKRKVMSYGYEYHFDSRSIFKGTAIPSGFSFLIDKVADLMSIRAEEFAEVLVTEYPEGSVINWHRDAPPFDIIAGISLMENCLFRLRPYDKTRQGRKSILNTLVQRRSLYILSGAARSDWEHSIAPVKATRFSLTLRTLRSVKGSNADY